MAKGKHTHRLPTPALHTLAAKEKKAQTARRRRKLRKLLCMLCVPFCTKRNKTTANKRKSAEYTDSREIGRSFRRERGVHGCLRCVCFLRYQASTSSVCKQCLAVSRVNLFKSCQTLSLCTNSLSFSAACVLEQLCSTVLLRPCVPHLLGMGFSVISDCRRIAKCTTIIVTVSVQLTQQLSGSLQLSLSLIVSIDTLSPPCQEPLKMLVDTHSADTRTRSPRLSRSDPIDCFVCRITRLARSYTNCERTTLPPVKWHQSSCYFSHVAS